jgi:hypothetical protein
VGKFLALVSKLGEEEKTSGVCREAYAATLAQYHPWLIQKGANFAMLALPLKKDLISKV